MQKTNAMRLLEQAGISFTAAEYESDGGDNLGLHAAEALGLDPGTVFKTLVLQGGKKGPFVCCIPVDRELDLKKAARAAGEKKADLLPLRDLTKITGYVRGGCSPIGMKKAYPTYLDETALLYNAIAVNAGAVGCQVTLSPAALLDFLGAQAVELCGE